MVAQRIPDPFLATVTFMDTIELHSDGMVAFLGNQTKLWPILLTRAFSWGDSKCHDDLASYNAGIFHLEKRLSMAVICSAKERNTRNQNA